MADQPDQQPQTGAEAAPLRAPEDDDDEYFDDSEDDEWANPPVGDAGDAAPRQQPTDRVEGVDEIERELAGERVPILFKMPDGTTKESVYRMGHTIAHIKSHLDDYNGLPYEKTTLKLDGMVCIDPLSLNDLPFKPNEVNVVVVELSN
jgi:hypothetical protein